MALFKFTKNILENKKIQLYNNGNHSRDFTYISDIVSGIFSILKKIIIQKIYLIHLILAMVIQEN